MDWFIPQFGFSYIGALFLTMLFVPNLFWVRNQPEGYCAEGESKFMQPLERIGQTLVTVMVLSFANLNIRHWTMWSCWLVAAALFMILYEGFWFRYFRGKHTMKDFYGSFCGIPVAGATLPVLAVFCLGIYGRSLWLLLAGLLLGIGHIGIHIQHKKSLLLRKDT